MFSYCKHLNFFFLIYRTFYILLAEGEIQNQKNKVETGE